MSFRAQGLLRCYILGVWKGFSFTFPPERTHVLAEMGVDSNKEHLAAGNVTYTDSAGPAAEGRHVLGKKRASVHCQTILPWFH